MSIRNLVRAIKGIVVFLMLLGVPSGIAIYSMTLAGLRMTGEGIRAPIEAYILGVLVWIFAVFITRFVAEEIQGSIKAI